MFKAHFVRSHACPLFIRAALFRAVWQASAISRRAAARFAICSKFLICYAPLVFESVTAG